MKILIVIGTRPEAIKMCPLVLELHKSKNIDTILCITEQHKEMLEQVLRVFDIKPAYRLNIMQDKQSLTHVTSAVLCQLEEVLNVVKPDLVLVHGDTTTALASALAAYYKKISVGHVEAGLRTYNLYAPYPEELNRQLVDRIAYFKFAPTNWNRDNLHREGITENVYVTGNTVIDSFDYTVKKSYVFSEKKLNTIDFDSSKVILVTAHRRENWGPPMENICEAVRLITKNHSYCRIVFPVHPNPVVRDVVYEKLSDCSGVLLLDPISVLDMHNLLARCYMILTDSGGLQEEGPHFGVPVLVMRSDTERPEAVEAGTSRIIGTKIEEIFNATNLLLSNPKEYNKMAKAVNPYGDGTASRMIAELIKEKFPPYKSVIDDPSDIRSDEQE